MAAFLFSPRAVASMLAALAAFAALAFMSAPAMAASQFVVIAAEPASQALPPGKVFVAGDVIELPDASTLTLLGEDGSVVSIPGPARVVVTKDAVEATQNEESRQKNRSTLSKLASLLAGEQRNADSLGVSRSIGGKERAEGLADPWVLSVHRSAQGCVRNEPIRLGRASDRRAMSLVVKGDTVDSVTELDWQAGESEIALPGTVPPTTREILIKADGRSVFIELNLAPDGLDMGDPMAVMGWMFGAGCDGQALAFARLLAQEKR